MNIISLKNFRSFAIALCAVFFASTVSAQDSKIVSSLRVEEHVYVVAVIMSIVMIGLLVFVLLTDRKVRRLEKMLNDK